MGAPVTVLKFGSSVLSDRGRLPSVVHHIYRVVRRGRQVVVVVSAIGRHTDVLLSEAHYIAEPAICDRALATLLGTGELQSAALLCMAVERAPRRFADVTYEDALQVANVLVQPKALEYLQVTRRRAEVTSLLHDRGTVVGATRSQLAPTVTDAPLNVAMIGLGAVGEGVYRHLKALPAHFALVGIGVRDVERTRDVPSVPIYTDVNELIEQSFDVLVDVSGDTDK